MSFRSINVHDAARAGRAPYNFVPLPNEVRWLEEGKEEKVDERPPAADRYRAELFSGVIDLRLTALTDFYVRGMWPLAEYRSRNIKEQPEPFQVNGKLRLPGSSIRGMVRNLVEILSNAPLAAINDSQLFFRAVGASPNPGDPTFDANAVAYKERIAPAAGTPKDPAFPIVRAGFLYVKGDDWEIRPAAEGPIGSQWYRIDDHGGPSDPQHVWFIPPTDYSEGYYHNHPNVYYRFGVVSQVLPRRPEHGEGYVKGFYIRSGRVGNTKYLQWVIHDEAGAPPPLKIPVNDVEAYLIDKSSRAPYRYSNESRKAPCFYVEWPDAAGERHVTFGHTPYFRLPYQTTVGQANPRGRDAGEARWDLAQAIFGRLGAANLAGQRGRVEFQDGLFLQAAWQRAHPGVSPIKDTAIHVVLGEPKPTTYQHYVVQRNSARGEEIHWDGNRSRDPRFPGIVRGHKLYWHRKGCFFRNLPRPTPVSSTFKPAKEGCVFLARIRFQNLRDYELGCLLTALYLPNGYAHKLGMGKPIGFGSFQVLAQVRLIERVRRYNSFFAVGEDQKLSMNSALSSFLNAAETGRFKNAFANWYFKNPQEAPTIDLFWQQPRFRELSVMLRLAHPNFAAHEFLNATRYLELGPLLINNHRQLVNEYLRLYGPQGAFDPAPRRILPPATQVASGNNIPRDPAPDQHA